MLTRQKLEQFLRDAIRLLKGRKREQAALCFATLCFSGGFVLDRQLIPDLEGGVIWIVWVKIGLYAGGLIALVYAANRIWRLVQPAELPPATDRPSAIKGPMAFTEADGELFRRLGRESELQKLLGLVLDDQVLMVVVRGASGAGKTSLLRAGLKHIIGDRAAFHYWEAVPTEPDKGLLRAVREDWPEGATKPASLDELVNPIDALGRQAHVIVLDQFEQLRGSRKMFPLLRRIVRDSRPPHRITWVIAFRREFSADWMDFISPEQERGVQAPQDVSLRLFTEDQAREVIGHLVNESNLKDSIEQSVINNLIGAATVEGTVSPVDIGIGLLVLAELGERQTRQRITIRDYQFAGGAEGLLTQYISRCLELFPKENQEAIMKAMLALRDPQEHRQRLPLGLTIEELAVEAGANARVFKGQMNRLADRDIRLLETHTPPNGSAVRYRLTHERLIPALYRLTGKLLAEVDQAKLKFQNAFQAWKTNDKRSRYLLKGNELRLVERFETQIPWGPDEQEKKTFLFNGKQRRRLVQAGTLAAVIALTGAGMVSAIQYQRYQHRKFLRDESGYPPELYDVQHQLKQLEMTEPLNLERFTWLSSDSIESLSVTAASSSNSVAGLASLMRCGSLKNLTLRLGDSQVSDLKPLAQLPGLTQLTLNLGYSQVRNLKFLEQLRGLTELTLDLRDSQVSDLKPLAELPNLARLRLELGNRQVGDLKPLTKLRGLRQLKLYFNHTEVSDLKFLTQLEGLTELTLDLTDTQLSDLKPLQQLTGLTELTLFLPRSQVNDLKPLAQLNGLTQLTLNLGASKVSDLKPLGQLEGLIQLTLDLSDIRVNVTDLMAPQTEQQLEVSNSQVSDLTPLAQLKRMTQLTLSLGGSQVRDLKPVEQLKGLTQLVLDISFSEVSSLNSLKQLDGLTQLMLFLNGSKASDLKPLEQLRRLTSLSLYLTDSQVSDLKVLEQLLELTQLRLDLRGSQVSDLKPLEQLQKLIQLELSVGYIQVSDLNSLGKLDGLTQLTVDFRDSQISDLNSLSRLQRLTQLTLELNDTQVSDLKPLEQLNLLNELTLNLKGSQVSDLKSLGQLNRLQRLYLEYATRTQRMSLRNIPHSLIELKF